MAYKYLTTTLPYVNADPHIGFAFEIVQADALARYWRLLGHEVFFNTGTDEHGQKIAEKADEAGQERQAYVDRYAGEFKKLGVVLNLSYDAFIRTTDERHKKAAQELWRRCEAHGDVYKKKYKGLYCVGDEMFMKESELIDGKCPNHPNLELQEIEEENYFFKLSNYQSYLEGYLSREDVIVPEWRRKEALTFVEKGLEDFSISREKARLDWGIPVPGDESQVMYVWFDALANYISTLGWPDDADGKYEQFWAKGEPMQMAGKDQVRFQSIMWQAMLKSAGCAPTCRVVYHGFINSGGQKMSKSLGNVISPYELIGRYGTDATRYLLLRHVHSFEDTDITWERLDEWYNANLANGLGNLVARVMKMFVLYREQYSQDTQFEFEFKTDRGIWESATDLEESLSKWNLNDVMDLIWKRIAVIDRDIATHEPYKLIKTNPRDAVEMVVRMAQQLYFIAVLLTPFMPDTAEKIKQAVRENKMPAPLFVRKE